jgi:hypothetical protein
MSTVNFITDQKGKKIAAVLPIRLYEQLLEESEELVDICAYDKAKAKKETPIPLRDVIRQRRERRNA